MHSIHRSLLVNRTSLVTKLRHSICRIPTQAKTPSLQRHRQTHTHPPVHPAIGSILARTQKSVSPPLHHSSTTTIASARTGAIVRQLSTSPSASQALNMSYSKQPSEYVPRKIGAPHTLEYRCYIEKDGQPVSPFHDIPLYANDQQTVLNMVVEIPRWTNAKLEVCPNRYTHRCYSHMLFHSLYSMRLHFHPWLPTSTRHATC